MQARLRLVSGLFDSIDQALLGDIPNRPVSTGRASLQHASTVTVPSSDPSQGARDS